ncbi:MAG: hypothetical protein JXR48_17685 [Candidatus Delongbacteria bacterium]|nr:hypothetical protein [Candidatus Delongbacteria bacterium]MBN2836790.1 hypothetical protein [Candidatus Delongbacteria bacterium]
MNEIEFLYNYPGIFWIIYIVIAIYVSYRLYKGNKVILFLLRSLSLVLISFLLFQPIISFTNKKEIKTKSILLIDDSRSMRNVNLNENILNLYDKVILNNDSLTEIDNLELLKFSNGRSNLNNFFNSKKFNTMKSENTLSRIDVITDGWLDNQQLSFSENSDIEINFIKPNETIEADLFIKDIILDKYNSKTELIIVPGIKNFKIDSVSVKISSNEHVKISKTLSFNESEIIIEMEDKQEDELLYVEIESNYKEKNYENNRRTIFYGNEHKISTIDFVYDKPDINMTFFVRMLKNSGYSVNKIKADDTILIKNFPVFWNIGLEYKTIIESNKINSYMICDRFGFLDELPRVNQNLISTSVKASDEPLTAFAFKTDNQEFDLQNLPDVLVFSQENKRGWLSVVTDTDNKNIISIDDKLNRIFITIDNIYKLIFTQNAFEPDDRFSRLISNLLNVASKRKVNENIKINPLSDDVFVGEPLIFSGRIYDELGKLEKDIQPILSIDNRKFYFENRDNNFHVQIEFDSIGIFDYTIDVLKSGKQIYSKKSKIAVINDDPELKNSGVNSDVLEFMSRSRSNSKVIPLDSLSYNKPKTKTIIQSSKDSFKLYDNLYFFIILIITLSIEIIIRRLNNLS